MSYLKSLNVQVIVGILLGIIFGVTAPSIALEQKLIGDVFVSLLKMLVGPSGIWLYYITRTNWGLGSIGEVEKDWGLRNNHSYILIYHLDLAGGF